MARLDSSKASPFLFNSLTNSQYVNILLFVFLISSLLAFEVIITGSSIMLSLQPPPPKQPTPSSSTKPSTHHFPSLKPSFTPHGKHRPPRLLPSPRRTNPLIWCGAFFCFIFSLLLILAGIAALIIFHVIKPKQPLFEINAARLNGVYLDSGEYLNGDFSFIANFSNPNRKMDLVFEYLDIEVYLFDRLIGTQAVLPFEQRRGQLKLEFVHVISSEVYLPANFSMELRKMLQSNNVIYYVKGTFRVKAVVGITHFSFWLYGRCELVMSGPPNGVLLARRCKTTRKN